MARSQTSIWKTIKVKLQHGGAETHLGHATSANAHGLLVIETCSFPATERTEQRIHPSLASKTRPVTP